jgi:hypothetical protein
LFNRDSLLLSSAKFWPQRAIYRPELSSHDSLVRDIALGVSHDEPMPMAMPKDNSSLLFEDCGPATLFREFAAECIELAQTNPSPEKRALYVKMAGVWHEMAQRWEKKG